MTKTIESKFVKSEEVSFRYTNLKVSAKNTGYGSAVLDIVKKDDEDILSLAKEIIEDRYRFNELSERVEGLEKTVDIYKSEHERNEAYLMLGSYVDFVIKCIVDELYDEDDEYKPRNLGDFQHHFNQERNSKEKPIKNLLLTKFELSVNDWYAVCSIKGGRNDIAHPEMVNIDTFSSFIKREPKLKDKFPLFRKIYKVYEETKSN